MAEEAAANTAETTATAETPAGATASAESIGNPFGETAQTPAEGQTQTTAAPGQAAAENVPGVPEKYTFSLPEKLVMSPEIESRFTEIAHGIGLTQEQADSLIKLHSDLVLDMDKQAETVKSQWAAESKKQGLFAPEKTRLAAATVRTFTDSPAEAQELMDDLISSGVAFKPNVQKFLQLIGSFLQEDTAPDGKDANKGQNVADLLFANSKYN